MDKTYTVAKVLFSKQVQGRGGLQYNIRFTANETGETSLSGFFNSELKPGQQITGQIVQKPGIDRNNQPVIYYNFNPAKGAQGPSAANASPEQWMALNRTLTAIQTELQMIRGLLEPKDATPQGPTDDFENFNPLAPEPIAPDDLPAF